MVSRQIEFKAELVGVSRVNVYVTNSIITLLPLFTYCIIGYLERSEADALSGGHVAPSTALCHRQRMRALGSRIGNDFAAIIITSC